MPRFPALFTSSNSSRGASPTTSPLPSPGGTVQPLKVDSLHIFGDLYDIFSPQKTLHEPNELLTKELHVRLRYTVAVFLTKPVHAESLKAEYRCRMIVETEVGDGQFQEPRFDTADIAELNWTIWKGTVFEPGKLHTFEVTGELPPKTPRSWKTPRGNIEHTMSVRFEGVTDAGRLRRTKKTVLVWNSFSMDADSPRWGLEFHDQLEDKEMVGVSVLVEKNLAAFVRFPDQCYKGLRSFTWRDAGIGRYFPCEISFPTATARQLSSIGRIEVDILQFVWFTTPSNSVQRLTQLAKDVYPITWTETIEEATIKPQSVSLSLADANIHGRFTSDYLRVRHQLRIVFHRKWFAKKFEWTGEVEIFHRDVGWETRGESGVLEIVRGQEGDYTSPPAIDKLVSK
jgi:hypothetical protein